MVHQHAEKQAWQRLLCCACLFRAPVLSHTYVHRVFIENQLWLAQRFVAGRPHYIIPDKWGHGGGTEATPQQQH